MDNARVSVFVGKQNLFLVLALGILLYPSSLLSSSPELDYVKIYKKITSASNQQKQGNQQEARKLFNQSLAEINGFRKQYPKWNPGIINFRISFINQNLEALGEPASNQDSEGSQQDEKASQKNLETQLAGDRQILNHLRSRVESLELEKSKLEKKLREALTASPDQIDPKELERARKKVRDLSIENQLLQVQLAESVKRAASIVPSDENEREIQDLSDQITILTLEKKGLSLEIERLKSQNVDATGELATTLDPGTDLIKLEDTIESLEEELESYKLELLSKTRSEIEMKETLENIQEFNQQLALDKETLESQVKDLESKLSELDKLSHYQSHIEALESDLATKDEEITKLASENQKLEEDNALLAEKIQNLSLANEKLNELLAAKEKKLVDMDAEFQASVTKYQSEIQRLRKLTSELQSSVSQASPDGSDELDELQSTITVMQKEVSSLKSQNDLLKDENALLKQWLSQLNSQLDNSGNQVIGQAEPRLANYQPDQLPKSKTKPGAYNLATGTNLGQPDDSNSSVTNKIDDKKLAQILKVEKELLEKLEKSPKDLETRNRYGALLMDKGDFKKARAFVNETIEMFPKESEPHVIKALLARREENFKEAVGILAKAIELSPKNANAHMLLGTILSELGHRKAAEESLRRAVRLDPKNPLAHFNLSVAYLFQKPAYKALAQYHYSEAVRLGHPRDAEVELRIQRTQ